MDTKLRQAAKTLAVGCIEDNSIDLRSIIDQGFRDAIDQKIAELSAIENSYKNIVGNLSLVHIKKSKQIDVVPQKRNSPKKKTSKEQIVFQFIKNEKKLLEELVRLYGKSEGPQSAKDYNWFKVSDTVPLLWKKMYGRTPSDEQIRVLHNPLRVMLVSLEKKNKVFRKGQKSHTFWALKGSSDE